LHHALQLWGWSKKWIGWIGLIVIQFDTRGGIRSFTFFFLFNLSFVVCVFLDMLSYSHQGYLEQDDQLAQRRSDNIFKTFSMASDAM